MTRLLIRCSYAYYTTILYFIIVSCSDPSFFLTNFRIDITSRMSLLFLHTLALPSNTAHQSWVALLINSDQVEFHSLINSITFRSCSGVNLVLPETILRKSIFDLRCNSSEFLVPRSMGLEFLPWIESLRVSKGFMGSMEDHICF